MNFKRVELPNGIRFIHSPVPALESATFTIWFGVGSRYEEDNIAGISHFLEHMAFKGGEKYPTADAVTETLDAMGADNNAATSQEYTSYYVRAAADLLESAVDVLADTLVKPVLDELEIEKERGVIIEEINMYEDDPQSCVNNLYGELIFPNHPLGRDIAGSKDTVNAIGKNDFIVFRNSHYVPENIIITVAGGVSFEKAYEIAEKYFGNLPRSEYQNAYKDFKADQESPRIALKTKQIEQANLMIGYPGIRHGEDTRYAEGLMGVILGSGMSSRLFREVREKRGLAYTVYANSSHYQDTGEFSAYAGVPVNKAEDAIKVILEELNKITTSNHGITEKELSKAKSFFKGHMALSMESTKAINYFLGHEEIKGGKLRIIEEVFENIDKVQIDEVVEIAKQIIKPERINLAIVGPYENKDEFEKLL